MVCTTKLAMTSVDKVGQIAAPAAPVAPSGTQYKDGLSTMYLPLYAFLRVADLNEAAGAADATRGLNHEGIRPVDL
jgi:hypothetical protein